MREGTGEALVAVATDVAFAYLADPRHAPEWFAGIHFADPPEGAPHAGMRWRFVQVRSNNRVVPVRMETYQPPTLFAWRTTLHWPRTNLRWEMRCEPDDENSTRLRMAIRIEPGPMGWLALWLARPAFRPDPAMQAQRAVERARAALLASASPKKMSPAKSAEKPEKRGRRRR